MLAGASGSGAGESPARFDLSQVALAHEPLFHIGNVEFRPATRELIHGGKASVIEPRVMQLLVALRRANGAVVSKDDLSHLVWEGRIVGEDAINRVVSRLRAVAEKQAGGVFRVETITKVGYRLVPAGGTAPQANVATHREPLFRRRDALIGGSVAAIGAVAGGAWYASRHETMPPEARTLVNGARNSLMAGVIDLNSDAIGELKQAAAIAPNNAEVWGLLAFAYIKLATGTPLQQRADLRARGFAAMRRAFSLEPNQGDALAAWAFSIPVYRNWYESERAYRWALGKRASHPELLLGLASVLAQVGRGATEAVPLIDKAGESLPHSPRVETMRINALWDTGQFDETEAGMDRAFKLWPRHFGIWFSYVYYLMYNGKAQQALGMITDVANRPIGIPDWNFDWTALTAKALATHDPADLRRALDSTKAIARRGTGFAENAGVFAGFVGDFDTAFRMFDALYFNRGFAMPDMYFSKEQGMYTGPERHTYILFRVMLRQLRRDSRFGDLTRELGLDDYWRRSNSRSLVIP
ncbi:winged helix-turn-helix domain-containing protein [Sphingomonas sp.]|uniref:winged helix-turn-helix domain-containing protein n=1 Tax=Sphingomonas sp. TaxID=28214 RepID=UPI00389B63D0